MCSRFSRTSLVKALQHRFQFQDPDFEITPEYNIAPTDLACVVVQDGEKRYLKRMIFGLIPHWAKDARMGLRCLNARSETVAEKPAFREPFKSQRCLVLTDGFFEWRREGREKEPYRIVRRDRDTFAMAGLWDTWKRPDGESFESFSIITTEPNELMATIHNRMPVILDKDLEALWLSPAVREEKTIRSLLKRFPSDLLEKIHVSRVVNSPRHKSEECVQPVA